MAGILIVDDDVVSVMELEEALSAHKYDVLGVAYNGLEAVEMERNLRPDLVLMDIKMPGDLDGISTADIILQQRDIPIIFVSGHDNEEFLERASQLAPAGYILKPFIRKQLIATIEIALRAAEKQKLTDDAIDRRWNRRLAASAMLTAAETQVANHIKMGKNSADISKLLSLSKKTVDWHRTNIRKKLGLNHKENLFSHLQKI